MVEIKEVYLKSEPAGGKMVILKEEAEAQRYFMMFVGDSEFAAIAKEKGLLESPRPLTHEVYLSVFDRLPMEFLCVEITHIKEETFYARIVFKSDGAEQDVDSRPSDAVALALNRKIPIMVTESLLRREMSQEEIKEYEGIIKSVKF